METTTLNDLTEIAKSNRLYSAVLSPITLGLISGFLITHYFGPTPTAIALTLLSIIFIRLIHRYIGTYKFNKRWLYLYLFNINHDKYYLFQDGAGRARVYYIKDDALMDLATNKIVSSGAIRHYIKYRHPIGGVMNPAGSPETN